MSVYLPPTVKIPSYISVWAIFYLNDLVHSFSEWNCADSEALGAVHKPRVPQKQQWPASTTLLREWQSRSVILERLHMSGGGEKALRLSWLQIDCVILRTDPELCVTQLRMNSQYPLKLERIHLKLIWKSKLLCKESKPQYTEKKRSFSWGPSDGKRGGFSENSDNCESKVSTN